MDNELSKFNITKKKTRHQPEKSVSLVIVPQMQPSSELHKDVQIHRTRNLGSHCNDADKPPPMQIFIAPQPSRICIALQARRHIVKPTPTHAATTLLNSTETCNCFFVQRMSKEETRGTRVYGSVSQ